jgi:FkbM family methyltransferase
MKKFFGKLGMKMVSSRPALQKYYDYLFRVSLRGMNIGGGAVCDGSGEDWVLKYVKDKSERKPSLVIFDVGANQGDYAMLCKKIMKDKRHDMYCFEPSKKTFEMLAKNVADMPDIMLVNAGFGEKREIKILYSDKDGSGLASLYNRNLEHHTKIGSLKMTEEVKIDTIDEFCTGEKIDCIDLLKLDVEGNELSCLKGAQKMLAGGKIGFIQFEFGGCNIDSRTYFQDFFRLLSPCYKIYRILEKGLFEIKLYSEADEIFLTTNYLAERKNDNN